ncbi:putative Mg2+ transporter-C (MgtC) family protein [Mucilaginibacter gracilis]|uniref:Putative Mg2+ transporter-C (MgtC) family protein n=1 Tax=Mucilaginibacter gracilis TaxID=423350 RepID=A0A495J728_9SPHI|nr:MgtC/SapB family protein [Mucilaginibacter gracilis]RKR84795.1 putative Mg2+ transporter-C (MgtC) family protein [Mucilaginibacter gracilis]
MAVNPTDIRYTEEVFKLFLSAMVGCLVGLEREIRRKPAGFRTLAIICVGSTLFTICSYKLGFPDNEDRIAANIITGVGFLGAGVIFRNGFSVSGITTAATIWIAAALGMLIGIGDYAIALLSLAVSLIILWAMQFLQNFIDARFQHRSYTISYKDGFDSDELQAKLTQLQLKARNFKETRQDVQTSFEFEVSGKESNLNIFNQWLKNETRIYSFMW